MTETVRYTGTARAFSTAAHEGVLVEQNQPVEVSDDLAVFLVDNHDFERVDDDDDSEVADPDTDDLDALDYDELQERAKEQGVAANQSADDLRDALVEEEEEGDGG